VDGEQDGIDGFLDEWIDFGKRGTRKAERGKKDIPRPLKMGSFFGGDMK
jgi:hypothetical protein